MGAGIGERAHLATLTASEQHRHASDVNTAELVSLQVRHVQHGQERPGHGLAYGPVNSDPEREAQAA